MDELARQVEEAREHVDVRWSSDREAHLRERIFARPAPAARRGPWAVGSALAAAAVLVIAWLAWPAPAPTTPIVALSDGSLARPAPAARLMVLADEPERQELRLDEGTADFEVQPRRQGAFRVVAGDVTVEVLGTAFTVERAAGRVRVAVARGRVAVRWPGGRETLDAGGAGWFPPDEPAPVAADVEAAEPPPVIAEPSEIVGVSASRFSLSEIRRQSSACQASTSSRRPPSPSQPSRRSWRCTSSVSKISLSRRARR